MKTAVCTLVVGKRYQRLFTDECLPGWRNYCQRHGYELVVFDRMLKDLGAKSPSWQKLFILEQPELKAFERIVWIDADIVIRRTAPPIEVPPAKLGYVYERPLDGNVEGWFAQFSMPAHAEIVQGGVLVLEPQHHDLLERVAKFPETSLYEMPALSACVSESGVGYRLDPRFNALLGPLMLDRVPLWILTNKPLKELLWHLGYPPVRRALREICANNWFIHAAGAKRDLTKLSHYLRTLEP